MSRVEGGGVFVDGPSLLAFESNEPGAVDLVWNGWLPMYRLDGRSPDERARVHAVNVANRRLSVAAFAGFVGRYEAALERCRTEDEVIALGRPRLPERPGEPGALEGERGDLDRIDSEITHLVTEALKAGGRARARLAGRPLPLDVTVDLRVGLGVDGEAGSCSVAASSSGGASASCKAAVGVGGKLGSGGRASGTVSAGPVSVAVAGDRIESLELSRGPAYVRLGPSSAGVGLGGRRELATGPGGVRVSAEARLGVDVRLLDAETVRRALSHEDHWTKKR